MEDRQGDLETVLDPANSGVLRWAWVSAKRWRAEWWLGGVVFGVVGVVTGFAIPASWGNKLELGLIAFGMAVVVVMVVSVGYALLRAAYEQRNALRTRLSGGKPPEPGKSSPADSHGSRVTQKAQAGKGAIIIQAGRDAHYTPPDKRNEDGTANE